MNPDPHLSALLARLDALADAGQLRRLSGAFARFIAALGPGGAPLLLACVALSELEGRGHSCLLLVQLARDPAALLGWDDGQWQELAGACGPLPKNVNGWRKLLDGASQVWSVGTIDFQQPLVIDGERLYLRRYWRDESVVAQQVGQRLRAVRAPALESARRWLDILFDAPASGAGFDWQKLACAIALRGTVSVITGGPGTGKTYTVARLLALLFALANDPGQLRVALAAPTGKAAARLKQSIQQALAELAVKVPELALPELTRRMGDARTLHSLLGARPDTRAFQHHAGNRLDVDVLIVDEASMVHLEMMAALLDALAPDAILILLGDKDQLASVEAGAVLGDLCHDAQAGGYSAATLAYARACGQDIPVEFAGAGGALAQQTVMLRASRRFGGPIGALALAVNAGDAARAIACLRECTDGSVAWIESGQLADAVQLAVSGRTPAGGGYQPYLEMIHAHAALGAARDALEFEARVRAVLRSYEAFRILCALREGDAGVAGLNKAIEARLEAAGLIRRRGEWYVGRPVMVTRNDHATRLSNGDIGVTLPDPARLDSLRVYFLEGEAVRSVLASRLRHVETAYAMTVHKSQGSEFRHTVLLLPKEGGGSLARELIYTGITRAREFFTLVAPGSAVLVEGIGRRTERASGLRERIETQA